MKMKMSKGISPTVIIAVAIILVVAVIILIFAMKFGTPNANCTLTAGSNTLKGILAIDGKTCVPIPCKMENGQFGVLNSDDVCIAPPSGVTTTTIPSGGGEGCAWYDYFTNLDCWKCGLKKCPEQVGTTSTTTPSAQCAKQGAYCSSWLGINCCSGLYCKTPELGGHWECESSTPSGGTTTTTTTGDPIANFVKWATDGWNGAVSMVSGAVSSVTNAWNNAVSITTNAWNGAVSSASDFVNGLGSSVTDAWNSAVSSVTNAWDSAVSSVTNAVGGAVSSVTDAWNNAVSSVTNAWDSVVSSTQNWWCSNIGLGC